MITDRTLILGLGNPILGDDGVGWRVAKAVAARLSELAIKADRLRGPVDIDCLAVGGLTLMERLIGYDLAFLVDAIDGHGAHPGQLSCLPLANLPNFALGHLNSAHDTTLHNALEAGRALGAHLPRAITVIAIEAQNPYTFSEELTPPVAASVPLAVDLILDLLGGAPV